MEVFMVYGYIYRITNVINGKKYIGQTTYRNPVKRWSCHKAQAFSGRGQGSRVLHAAIAKYGVDSLKFSVVMRCNNREHLDRAEGMCIRLFKSSVSAHGYNLLEGGNARKHSPETRQKFSQIRKGKPFPKHERKPMPQEQRLRQSAYWKGRPCPQLHSDDAKRKREETKSRKLGVNRAPVFVNGFLYPNLSIAAEATGIKYDRLWRESKGKCKVTNQIEYLSKE
jgi:group I intron endonuclease